MNDQIKQLTYCTSLYLASMNYLRPEDPAPNILMDNHYWMIKIHDEQFQFLLHAFIYRISDNNAKSSIGNAYVRKISHLIIISRIYDDKQQVFHRNCLRPEDLASNVSRGTISG